MTKIYKILFMMSLTISILMAMSSYSWMGVWMSLEMNLLSFIPLMNNSTKTSNSETSMKYFLIQAMASTILILSMILISMNWNFMILTFNTSLLMKMGAAPLHFWFPEVMEGLAWNNCLILMTLQKIIPMTIISIENKIFITTIVLFSMMVSGIMGLNQISMRKILSYSSINHIGWMLASLMSLKYLWIVYFCVYSVISISLISFMEKFNINSLKHLISFNNNNSLKLFFMFNIMSLGGLPPLLGFFPKWIIIQSLIKTNMLFLSIIMVMLTLLVLYYYIRVTFNSLIIINSNLNYKFYPLKMNTLFLILNSTSIFSMVIFTLFLNLS